MSLCHSRPSDEVVRSRPIALGIPPQPGEGVRESGWRLGRGEGLAKFVESHATVLPVRLLDDSNLRMLAAEQQAIDILSL